MRYIFLLLVLGCLQSQAQLKSFIISVKGDTLNAVDNNGKKQGPWVVHVDALRGEPGYEEEGYYEDDRSSSNISTRAGFSSRDTAKINLRRK